MTKTQLEDTVRRYKKRMEESENALREIHDLLNPGKPFCSWQRVWQDVARLTMNMPDATVDEIRIARAFRDVVE